MKFLKVNQSILNDISLNRLREGVEKILNLNSINNGVRGLRIRTKSMSKFPGMSQNLILDWFSKALKMKGKGQN